MESDAARMFSTVPQKDYLGLNINSGLLDGQKIAKILDFKTSDVAKATGVAPENVRYDERMSALLRERLLEIATVLTLVAEYFDGNAERTAWWFKVPNPSLGDLKPRDLIRAGRYKRLLRFVLEAREAEQAASARGKR